METINARGQSSEELKLKHRVHGGAMLVCHAEQLTQMFKIGREAVFLPLFQNVLCFFFLIGGELV